MMEECDVRIFSLVKPQPQTFTHTVGTWARVSDLAWGPAALHELFKAGEHGDTLPRCVRLTCGPLL